MSNLSPPAAPARPRVASALFLAIFIEGLMLAVPGPTLDVLSQNTTSTIGRIGIIFTANGLGFVAGALIAGRWYARVDGNRVLSLALLAMAIATVLVPMATSLSFLLFLFVIIGTVIGLIDVGANTMLVWEYGKRVPPYMNALHLFWGIGAFAAPLVVAWLAESAGDALRAYWVFAAMMLPCSLWVALAPAVEVPADAGREASPAVWRRHTRLILLLGALFFLHVGAELSFGGWIFSYAAAGDLGADTTARVVNSIFWGGLVVGRLFAIPLSLRLTAGAMIWLDLLGAGVALAVVAFLGSWSPAIWLGAALFGVSIASIFASCLNFAGQHMPITSQVTSVFLIGASIGSMTLPWLTGVLFDRAGPWTMPFVVGATILGALALFLVITKHTAGESVDATA